MKLLFLGTGAADWDWSGEIAAPNRGSTQTLIDGYLCIDAGESALRNMRRFGVELSAVTDLLITHSHTDHFNEEAIRAMAQAPDRKTPLRVCASPQALARLDDGMALEKHPLYPGTELTAGIYHVTALPANHVLPDPEENSFNFLFEGPDVKRMYYALDSGWMVSRTRRMLKPLDMVIWDATSGGRSGDWRFADHNDLVMIRHMRTALAELKLIGPETIHVFDHLSRDLWPADDALQDALARQFDGLLARDGMQLVL